MSKKRLAKLLVVCSITIGIVNAIFGFSSNVGESNYPTLHSGDMLFTDTAFRLFNKKPKRGDIVSVKLEADEPPRFKRVIGLPGESLAISGGKVFIDGVELIEPYLSKDQITTRLGEAMDENVNYGIPNGCYIILGDNRLEARDSRDYGCVALEKIETVAWGLLRYPFIIQRL